MSFAKVVIWSWRLRGTTNQKQAIFQNLSTNLFEVTVSLTSSINPEIDIIKEIDCLVQRKRRTRQKRNIPVAVVLALRTNIWVSIWLNLTFRKTMCDFNNAVRCSKICLGLFIWIKPKVPPLFQCNLCFYCAQKPKWIKLVVKCWHLISLIPRHNIASQRGGP